MPGDATRRFAIAARDNGYFAAAGLDCEFQAQLDSPTGRLHDLGDYHNPSPTQLRSCVIVSRGIGSGLARAARPPGRPPPRRWGIV
jgi:hypothetical protein